MKVQARLQGTLFLFMFLLLFFRVEGSAWAGVLDSFWNVVYWVGDSLSKTTLGQGLEKGFDGFFSLFNIEIGAGRVVPDYRNALTGTLSTKIGSAFSDPSGINQGFRCEVLQPRMSRTSVGSPWELDKSVKDYMEKCIQKAGQIMLRIDAK